MKGRTALWTGWRYGGMEEETAEEEALTPKSTPNCLITSAAPRRRHRVRKGSQESSPD